MFRILITVILLTTYGISSHNLIEVFKWKQLDFSNHEAIKENHINNNNNNNNNNFSPDFVFPGSYGRPNPKLGYTYENEQNNFNFTPYNNVPMGANHFRGRLFITIPRRRTGIPATLNVIKLDQVSPMNKSPQLTGYPSYDMNRLNDNLQGDNDRIVSVYRTRIDSCNRMWFVDTGMLEYPNNRQQIKPPSIWIINLENDSVIRKISIPANIVTDGRGLASITVDVNSKNCNDAFAYIPDLFHYQLHVYRFSDNNMWTFQHNYFNFDPLAGDLSIANQKFQWNDGIFSITLGKTNSDGYRTAYFHAMASNEEFAVSTKTLRNQTNSERDWHGVDFQHLGTRGTLKQSTMHDYDPKTGVIFYDEISEYGVGCWNTNKVLNPQNVALLDSDVNKMIYPSDLNIDRDGTMWVMTNSMPVFIYSQLNQNEYNFRVWKQDTTKIIKNSVCQ